MLGIVLLVAVAVFLSTLFHYEGLRLLSLLANADVRNPQALMLVIIFGALALHIAEIGIYALAYWFGDVVIDAGQFAGSRTTDSLDYFYFSAESYTSLGMGDIFPLGELRLIAGVEALNGLLLIAWSASFTYLAMERFWTLKKSDKGAL